MHVKSNLLTGRGEWVSSHHAFLSSFVNLSGLGSTKLSLNTGMETRALSCDSSYGPVFGNGNDLHISGTILVLVPALLAEPISAL